LQWKYQQGRIYFFWERFFTLAQRMRSPKKICGIQKGVQGDATNKFKFFLSPGLLLKNTSPHLAKVQGAVQANTA
jgi:hypothetical protein